MTDGISSIGTIQNYDKIGNPIAPLQSDPWSSTSLPITGMAGQFSPENIFNSVDIGAFYLPAKSLFRDANGTRPSRPNGIVQFVQDISGKANNATPTAQSSSIRYFLDDITGKPLFRQAMGVDSLTTTFPSALGSKCTIVWANHTSVEIDTNVNIGTTYTLVKGVFFGCLIINRALTATETTLLTTYFSKLCPAYSTGYTYYASPTGNDSNSGLTAARPKTMAGGLTAVFAAAIGSSLALLPGTHTFAAGGFAAGIILPSNGTNTKISIYCPFGPVIINGSENGQISGTNCLLGATPVGYKINIYGEGNLTVAHLGNDGFAGGGGGPMYGLGTNNVWDAESTDTYDGMTHHQGNMSTIRRCCAHYNGKDAVADVGASAAVYIQCAFFSTVGAANPLGTFDGGTWFDFYQCDFLPDPNQGASSWANVAVTVNTTTGLLSLNKTFRYCRFGSPFLTPAATNPSRGVYNTTFTGCYFNGQEFQPGGNDAEVTNFINCFGPGFSVYPIYVLPTINITNCVFTGKPPGSSFQGIIDARYYLGGSYTFGKGTVKNTIISGAAVGVFVTPGETGPFNTNWALTNNCYFNNTLNYTAGVAPAGTDITGQDPYIIDVTSDEYDDWCVLPMSVTLGAGVGGADIGLGVASNNQGSISKQLITKVNNLIVAPYIQGTFTIAQLLAIQNPVVGSIAWVSDTVGSVARAWDVVIAGGAANTVLGFAVWNGTNWVWH